MNRIIDINSWNRKEVYDFFRAFDEPYFGITAQVDVTIAYQTAKASGISFFLWYLHKSLCAVNQIPALKYRIVDQQVVEYNSIHASATINREDGSFGFSFIVFDQDFEVFNENAQKEIHRIRTTNQLFPERNGADCVHCSSLPWINFTALSHARSYKNKDSVPKISFGKMTREGLQLSMPFSVHVHHGLVDGKDVGAFYELFQELLNRQ
jgi:chloramphenicol O-acetyltransferase type A